MNVSWEQVLKSFRGEKARGRRGKRGVGGKEKLKGNSNKSEITHTHTHSDTQREGEKCSPPQTPGPNNILLYQRFIVNQLAEAAGVCEVGVPGETMGSPVV